MKRYSPWVILGVFVIYAAAGTLTPVRSHGGFDLSSFAQLPVQLGGRVQPMDTAARIGLLQLRGTVDVPLERASAWRFWHRTDRLEPTEWLAELMMNPAVADSRPVFAIRDATVLQKLHLTSSSNAISYCAFNDLQPNLDLIAKEAARITKLPAAKRAPWEHSWMRLRNAMALYERLKNSVQPNSFIEGARAGKHPAYDFGARLTEYISGLRAGVKAAIARKQGKEDTLDKATEDSMRAFAKPFVGAARVALLKVVPPADLATARDRWEDVGTAIVNSARTAQLSGSISYFAGMSSAFAQGKPAAFNGEVTKYRQWLASKRLTAETSRARYEFLYNRAQPYVRAAAIYLVASVLLIVSAALPSPIRYKAGAMLVGVAFVLQTAGLLFEMMIEGRPPMTNMYSTIIFLGWIVVIGACIAQRVWRTRSAMPAGAVAGLLTLVVAHSLAAGGIIQSMRSALDASFWAAATAGGVVLMLGDRVATLFARSRARGSDQRHAKPASAAVAVDAEVVTTS